MTTASQRRGLDWPLPVIVALGLVLAAGIALALRQTAQDLLREPGGRRRKARSEIDAGDSAPPFG